MNYRFAHRCLDTSLVLGVCVFVYGLLRQSTFYGVDGWRLMRRLAQGDTRSNMHLLYKPLFGKFAELGESLSLTLYQSGTWYSAIMTAVGVALFHAANARLLDDRRRALLATGLIGALPATVFFATVIERHGPFMAYAGLATFVGSFLVTRPTPIRAAMLGIAAGIAYAGHSTGVLMFAFLLPLAALWQTGPIAWRRWLILGGTAAATTALSIAVAQGIAVREEHVQQSGANFEFLVEHALHHVGQPLLIPVHVWQEWILAFAPVSLAFLGGLTSRELRGPTLATVIGLVVYLGFSFAILGDFEERGAYLLPMAFPAALVTVRRWPMAASLGGIAVALSLATAQVLHHDDHRTEPVAEGISAIAGEARPYLLIGDPADFEMLFLHYPDYEWTNDLWDLLEAGGFDPAVLPGGLPLIESLLREKQKTRPLILPSASARYLENPHLTERGDAGPVILEFLRSRFTLRPVEAAGFKGFVLD